MLRILDPLFASLARLAVAQGILFPDLVERLKSHYLDAARNMTVGKITDSRLSVMTGLQRRDIVRLKGLDEGQQRPNHLSRLVALWRTEHPYCETSGPLALARNGPEPSFETLARLVRKDVHPRTMLDTLVMAGTVEISDEDQTVSLLQMSYQPLPGSEDQLAYLARNLADHLGAATDNVRGLTPPHFERAVHYTQLTAEQVEELKTDYQTLQMGVFERLSKKAARLKKTAPPGSAHRFRAGGYFFQKTEEAE